VDDYRSVMDLQISPASGPTWVPVDSCTLPTAEQPLRVAAFDELFASSLRGIEHPQGSSTRVRLVLEGDEALAARVQRLADAETACCSFFTFTLTPLAASTTRMALDIAVPGERADVLAALIQRAERVRRSAA
jgi:hypothetical protein